MSVQAFLSRSESYRSVAGGGAPPFKRVEPEGFGGGVCTFNGFFPLPLRSDDNVAGGGSPPFKRIEPEGFGGGVCQSQTSSSLSEI